MKRVFVVLAVMFFVLMATASVQAAWWDKKPAQVETEEAVIEAPQVEEVMIQAEPEATAEPMAEAVAPTPEPVEEAAVPTPEPAVVPEPPVEAKPEKKAPQREARPAPEAQQAAPEVSEADVKRGAVAAAFASGNKKRAFDELKGVLRNGNKYHAVKEWATLELMNRAQAEGELAQVTQDLETGAGGKDVDNIMLQRAIAEGYLRQRNFSKVVTIYEELAKTHPQDYVIQTRLTDYYILAKDFLPAIARLEPIVNVNPDDDYHCDILMNAYVQAGMEDKAMALFKKRLEKEPKSPGLRARYAQALQDFGKYRESAAEWEKAAQFDPRNTFFQNRAAEIRAKAK